jgi:hypothetical protein
MRAPAFLMRLRDHEVSNAGDQFFGGNLLEFGFGESDDGVPDFFHHIRSPVPRVPSEQFS